MRHIEAVENALKALKNKGADDVVVSGILSQSSQIKYSDNKINATKDWDNISLNIFASFGGRIVGTSIKDVSTKGVELGISQIASFVRNLPINKDFKGIAKGPFKYPKIEGLYDKKIANLHEKSVDLVEAGINAALNEGSKRSSGVLEHGNHHTYLMTSNGVQIEEKGTSAYFSIRSFFDKDSSGHRVCNSTTLNKFDVEGAGSKAAKIAVQAKGSVNGKPGKYDILFSPLAFANILERVGDAASAFSVESGLSFLSKDLNKMVASKNVTLYDDSTLKGGIGSRSCDDEGTPSQKTELIKNGKLLTYLHNYSSAQRFKAKPTGNAGLISPEMSNLLLKPGDVGQEEMIKSIKSGLYITNVWYTRFQNYQTGQFSTIPRDGIFKIKNGEIVGSIRNIRLSENILNIMKNISTIGNSSEQIVGWEVESPVITPMVFVKGLNITVSE
ncbi:MAG: TldD/PmbA family protein [Nanoarchaeota archaeon]|nr:TldD/PmbA family protein [Nanoarchaeota archaeon]